MARLATLVVGCACVALAAAAGDITLQTFEDLFLKGDYLQIGLHAQGTLGSRTNVPEGFAVSGTPLGIVYDWGKDGFDVGSPPFAGDYVGPNGARWCIEYKAVGDDTTHRDCNRGGSLFFGEIIGNVQDLSDETTLRGQFNGFTQRRCVPVGEDACGQDIIIEVTMTYAFFKDATNIFVDVILKNIGSATLELLGHQTWINPTPDGSDDIEAVRLYNPLLPDQEPGDYEYVNTEAGFMSLGSFEAIGNPHLIIGLGFYAHHERPSEEVRRRRDDWQFNDFLWEDWSWVSTDITCEANCNSGDSAFNDYDQECRTCDRARRSADGHASQMLRRDENGFPILSVIRQFRDNTGPGQVRKFQVIYLFNRDDINNRGFQLVSPAFSVNCSGNDIRIVREDLTEFCEECPAGTRPNNDHSECLPDCRLPQVGCSSDLECVTLSHPDSYCKTWSAKPWACQGCSSSTCCPPETNVMYGTRRSVP